MSTSPAKQAIVPLNGTQTHPLSDHAKEVLIGIAKAPVPRSTVNPGVANRLSREDLVEEVMLTSPYKAHRGRKCGFLQITQLGRDRLQELDKATSRI